MSAFWRRLHAWPRYHTHRHITIVQGNSHFWNCFPPRDGDADDVRFFDCPVNRLIGK